MERPTLRLLIKDKLADGRLPQDHIPSMWGGPGNGDACNGCGEAITEAQMLMEGIDALGSGVQFHAACFYLWDTERQVLERA